MRPSSSKGEKMNFKSLCLTLIFTYSLGLTAQEPKDYMAISQRYDIEKTLRLCCAFSNDRFLRAFKFSRITSVDTIGPHKFLFDKDHKWKREKNGILYTCRAGFIDMAHLRDHADITLHIYNKLLNNPSIIRLKKAPTLRFFKVKDLSHLTSNELAQLAAAMAYDVSVWHEIKSMPGFKGPSMESNSPFSLEDNISNFMGTQIGLKAILAGGDFNKNVDHFIKEFLTKADAIKGRQNNIDLMNTLKGTWWSRGNSLKSVKKRRPHTYGELYPLIPAQAKNYCPASPKLMSFQTVNEISNGDDPNQYYDFVIFTNQEMREFLKKNKILHTAQKITKKQFIPIIEAFKHTFEAELGKDYQKSASQ